MSRKKTVAVEIFLEYWVGEELAGSVYRNAPVEPHHMDELVIGIRTEEDLRALGNVAGEPAQVHLAGSRRALESLGKYLFSVARLETLDPEFHDHFENVRNDEGGTVHLIIRRVRDGAQ